MVSGLGPKTGRETKVSASIGAKTPAPAMGHWAPLGDVCGCHDWCELLASGGTMDATKSPAMPRTGPPPRTAWLNKSAALSRAGWASWNSGKSGPHQVLVTFPKFMGPWKITPPPHRAAISSPMKWRHSHSTHVVKLLLWKHQSTLGVQ